MPLLKSPFKMRFILGALLSVASVLIIIIGLKLGHAQESLHWQRTGGPDGAINIAVISFHPANDSILYAGTNRGLYKTIDGGSNWNEVTGGLPTHLAINDIVIDHQNPDYMYARTDFALYGSADGGYSWALLDLDPQGEGGYRLHGLALDPNQPAVLYQVVCFWHLGKNEIWKSEDHGATWSCLYSVGPSQELDYSLEKILISHFDSNTMWVSAHRKGDEVSSVSGVQVSHDGGETWSPYGAYDPLEGTGVAKIVLHPRDSLAFYVSGRNYPDLVYRTQDGGQTWDTILSERNADISVVGIYVDPNDPNLIYIAWGAFFLVSRDGGVRWDNWDGSNMNRIGTDFGTMAVSPADRNLIYLGGVGGIVKSSDGGVNFMAVNQGLRSLKLRCLKMNPYDPNEVHALSFRGYGMYKTINGGNSWFRSRWSRVSFCSMLIDIAQSDPDIVYVTGFGVFRSSDAGTNWEHINNQFGGSHAHGVAIDPFDENIIYVGIGADRSNPLGQGMYRSLDGGETWHNIDNGFPSPVHVAEIKIDPTNPRIIYLATRGEMGGFDLPNGPGKGIFKSTNMGEEWFPINHGLANLSVHAIAINPQEPSILYAATEAHSGYGLSGGMFKSTDGGESWFSINNGLPPNDMNGNLLNLHTMVINPSNPEVLYVGRLQNPDDVWNTSGNIYKTTDGGATWFRFDDGLAAPNSDCVPGIEYLDIDPTGSVVYCGTYDGGVYKLGSLPDSDAIPPVIMAGPALFNFTPKSVTVKWNTHEPSTSIIEYGVLPGYGQSFANDSLVLQHAVMLADLDHDTTYHFRVGSADSLGQGPTWSKDFTFKLSEADIEEPQFINATDLDNATRYSLVRIEAEVSDNYGVQEVRLFYSTDNGAHYNEVLMSTQDATSFSASFTPSPEANYVDYYFQAADASGNISYLPETAPFNTYAFSITDAGITPYLYVSLVDLGTAEVNLQSGEVNYPFNFNVARWIPYANDSLMVGIRRAGIVIVETKSNQVTGEVDYPNGSEDYPWASRAIISPDDKYLYMQKVEFKDTIAVINLETLSFEKVLTTGSDPDRRIKAIAASADGRLLYVTTATSWQGSGIESMNAHPYKERPIELMGGHKHSAPRAIESNSAGSGYLHIIEVETGDIIKVIPLGIEAGGIDCSHDYRYLYAVGVVGQHPSMGVIYKIDTFTNTVVDSAEFGPGTGPFIHVTRKSNACYIRDPRFYLMDLEQFHVIRSVDLDFERQIYEAIMTDDDNYFFLSDRYYGEVLILDTRTNTYKDTLWFNAIPNGLAVVSKRLTQTSVDDHQQDALPQTLSLSQNYPNPWNPTTSIRFEIPGSYGNKVKVRLRIYDLQGRLVRELLNEVKQPGSYGVEWKGENDRGSSVASGIYFYELRAGGDRKTRKMVLVR